MPSIVVGCCSAGSGVTGSDAQSTLPRASCMFCSLVDCRVQVAEKQRQMMSALMQKKRP